MTQDAKPKEIKRPDGSIANLQKAMGLENDRAVYMNCRVSFFFIIYLDSTLINWYVSQLLAMFWPMLEYHLTSTGDVKIPLPSGR